MAYYKLEPFGESRADLRSGIIASTIANVNRQKGGPTYKAQDFMPYLEPEKLDPRALWNKIKTALTRDK